MGEQGYLLLIEDNINVQGNNKKILERRGYTIKQAMSLSEAREIMARDTPRAIVLDIMLPDGSGLDFLKELRETSNIPVLLLTAFSTPEDFVSGLSLGGDDYLAKPYNLDVFLAKMEALMRRSAIVPDTLQVGAIALDTVSHTATLNGVDLLLSQKEFALLQLLTQNENRPMSAEYLYEKVWGQPMAGNSKALNTAVSRLRKKLKGCGYTIKSGYGSGYRFEPEGPK